MNLNYMLYYGPASNIARRVLQNFAARNGIQCLEPHGPAVITAVTETMLDEFGSKRIILTATKEFMESKARVHGGLFDGQDVELDAVHKIVQTPAGRLHHLQAVYLDRGPITQQQAEEIVGRKLA